MRKNNIVYALVFCLASMVCFNACDEDEDYPQAKVFTESSIALTYENLTSYPVLNTIQSEKPNFDLSGQYKFIINAITSMDGIIPNKKLFSVDAASGVITIDNTSGTLDVSTYQVFLAVLTANGKISFSNPAIIDIVKTPISLTYNPTVANAGFFEQGEMGVAHLVNTDGGTFENVSYKLIDAPTEGVSINEATGIISKGIGLPSGANKFSVKVITDLGVKNFVDVFTINVGAEPTISYPGVAGGIISDVTVSPWSSYTSQVPALIGMNDEGGYAFLNLPVALEGSVLINSATGVVSMEADANLIAGSYPISITVTNSDGIEVNFTDLFNLIVEEKWDVIVDGSDFDNLTATESDFINFPDYENYIIGESTSGGLWTPAFVGAKNFKGLRRFNPGSVDVCVVRKINGIDVNMKKMRVSFNEIFGYNDDIVKTVYDRSFSFGYDVTTISTGVFDTSEWSPLMGLDDIRWNSVNGWGLSDQTTYSNIEIPIDNTKSDLYLNWRLAPKYDNTSNGQYCIGSIIVEVAKAYTAIESLEE